MAQPSLTRFFGRARELAAFAARRAEGRRVIELAGPPGAGKSHLARVAVEGTRAIVLDDATPLDLDAALDRAPLVVLASRRRLGLPGVATIEIGGLGMRDALSMFDDR